MDFPAPPAPEPDSAEPEKEPMHQRRAAYILEDLQMYCEEMLGIEAGLADTWAERADALTVAIAALRQRGRGGGRKNRAAHAPAADSRKNDLPL